MPSQPQCIPLDQQVRPASGIAARGRVDDGPAALLRNTHLARAKSTTMPLVDEEIK
jgi:hypothetical protein